VHLITCVDIGITHRNDRVFGGPERHVALVRKVFDIEHPKRRRDGVD
jgi:hypothetical protein